MREAEMNNPFVDLYHASGIDRVVETLKRVGGECELPLADILVLSRILFAIVMIGFIGYFFDRVRQTKPTKNPARQVSQRDR
jgi:hypothetical protein